MDPSYFLPNQSGFASTSTSASVSTSELGAGVGAEPGPSNYSQSSGSVSARNSSSPRSPLSLTMTGTGYQNQNQNQNQNQGQSTRRSQADGYHLTNHHQQHNIPAASHSSNPQMYPNHSQGQSGSGNPFYRNGTGSSSASTSNPTTQPQAHPHPHSHPHNQTQNQNQSQSQPQSQSQAAPKPYLTQAEQRQALHPPSQGPMILPHQDLNTFLESFWTRQMDNVEGEIPDWKSYNLPLARIKKVMKSDEEVRMISAEAPIMFSKACEIFISELTCRAWLVAESHKRRTLQKSDVAAAIAFSDMFDFLIDIVPRDDGSNKDGNEGAEGNDGGEGNEGNDGNEGGTADNSVMGNGEDENEHETDHGYDQEQEREGAQDETMEEGGEEPDIGNVNHQNGNSIHQTQHQYQQQQQQQQQHRHEQSHNGIDHVQDGDDLYNEYVQEG
ncbi:uncharacterized protein I303_106462 [Kwoniella dejecticola CBS 10117]|uniref:Transcription factor CBF/NF-Y/archaeal histone domain-containing protein n=1 Tax=Kwoniella dejecticola CBS 10117 TaxID=1296121 RepID=A0A1A5ZUM3_9TREE|nr:uncharacterized protein I303_08280 [Kwoniella dejecticola CBS 10117]OBR81510.1 hypothetical protein I303_08280 [Kwoniella dejecticola CBS 10117]